MTWKQRVQDKWKNSQQKKNKSKMKSSHNEISVTLCMACARCLCMLYRYVCYNYNRMLGRGRSRNFLNCGLAWLGLIHFARTKYGNIFFAYVQIRSVCASPLIRHTKPYIGCLFIELVIVVGERGENWFIPSRRIK